MFRLLTFLPILLLAGILSACGTDSSSGEQQEAVETPSTPVTVTQSGGSGNVSSISLRLTDAPIDKLAKAVVEFTAVELKRQSGGFIAFTLDNPMSIDLLTLQGGNTADLLINVPADADDYKEIRLFTSAAAMANYVELLAGGTQPLQIPGGSGSGLKLKQDFTVTENQAASFIIDFDLRQSIRSPGNSGNYQFKPVMRLVTVAGAGNLSGTVNPALLTAPTCSDALVDSYNAAYIFAGLNVVPDDINQSGNNTEPVATATIAYDANSGNYVFTASFLPAGDYTIAFTCNADLEDLEADDNLFFFGTQNAAVIANNTVFLRPI